MSKAGAAKRYLIDRFAGAEKRALGERFERLEARQLENLARLEELSDKLLSTANDEPASVAAIRRLRAEQKLWAQIGRLADLPLTGPARSVIFLHHSYYHFFYLARELRKRGWRAVSASIEDPNGINAQYFHGEDVNMHDPDPLQHRANMEVLFEFAKNHFRLMHFSGAGSLSFFPAHFQHDEPPDILEWKKLGKKVAYTINGCKDATAQSSVHRWAITSTGKSLCDNCVWQNDPVVCSDEGNLAWGAKLHKFSDAIFSEMQPSLDYLASAHSNVIRGPHTMANDEAFWHPDLEIPVAFRVPRGDDEVIVYHAVGNYDYRSVNGRNIKGTPAVVEAIERLRSEGANVRLMFFSRVPNTEVRYFQAQADIVVDQLWAGSYGATARESMLLGKPVVGFINPFEFDPADRLEVLETAPIVNATVDTIYDVLKDLVSSAEKRRAIGRASREFAVRWHGARACAERYEAAYDRIMAGSLRPELP